MNLVSNGLRQVTAEALGLSCDVPTRQARRYLKAHFASRIQRDGAFGLTEFEHIEAVRELRKKAPIYVTGFSPAKGK